MTARMTTRIAHYLGFLLPKIILDICVSPFARQIWRVMHSFLEEMPDPRRFCPKATGVNFLMSIILLKVGQSLTSWVHENWIRDCTTAVDTADEMVKLNKYAVPYLRLGPKTRWNYRIDVRPKKN
jgi:hypothetical protein